MATGHDLAMALRAAYLAMHRRSDARFARLGVTEVWGMGGAQAGEVASKIELVLKGS